MNNNTAVLWTGGKDCALAFLKAQRLGYNITHLVTFAPEKARFRAHNLHLIKEQAKTIGLPHLILTVKRPMKESYEDAIAILKNKYNVHTLVTGDIDEIENHDNWIEERSKKSKMKVFNPLWKKDRKTLLNELISEKFTVIFSLVKKPFFDKNWVGKKIDTTTINKLNELNIDLCGENGEYHTMVLNAPFYKTAVNIEPFLIHEETDYFYLTNS